MNAQQCDVALVRLGSSGARRTRTDGGEDSRCDQGFVYTQWCGCSTDCLGGFGTLKRVAVLADQDLNAGLELMSAVITVHHVPLPRVLFELSMLRWVFGRCLRCPATTAVRRAKTRPLSKYVCLEPSSPSDASLLQLRLVLEQCADPLRCCGLQELA